MLRLIQLLVLLTLTLNASALEKVEIKTLRGQMKYDTESFTVSPGAKVQLTLKNEDDMHHNLIICSGGKGIEQELAQKAWELAADGFEKQWIPEHPALLFATPMADPQKSVTLGFNAPDKPGTYPYVCTLPGHSMIMNGEMIVSKGGARKGKNGLSELTFMLYEGKWEMLPDFSQLTPIATDHVKGGLITLKIGKRPSDYFGIVYRAKLQAPADGKYSFEVSSDDGTKLLIDGKEVLNNDAIHGVSSKQESIQLSKGSHDLEIQYFEYAGGEEINISWSGPGFKDLPLSADHRSRSPDPPTGMPLAPSDTEAIIYRNFIEGAGPRAIGVGYPGGANIAYDADQCRIALIWQGAFIDAARHWIGRGQGFQPPLGYNVIEMVEGSPIEKLESLGDPWPDTARKTSKQRPDNGYRFAGYKLTGVSRAPQFRYLYHDVPITDLFETSGAPATGKNSNLIRKLSVRGKLDGTHHFRVAAGKSIEKTADERYLVDDIIIIGLSGGGEPIIRDSAGQQELLVPIPSDAQATTINQTFTWK